MAVYTYVIDTEHNIYEGLTVERRLRDGESAGWRVTAKEGYKFYDPETDIMNEEESEINYSTLMYLPNNFNWDNFKIVVVKCDNIE